MFSSTRAKSSAQTTEPEPVRRMREAMESLEKVIRDTKANRQKARQIAANALELATNLGRG